MKHLPIWILILCYLIASCVPTRPEMYIRAPKDRTIIPDEISSTYQQLDFQYELRPNDVVSIKVTSATDTEFDFLNYEAENRRNLTFNEPLLSGYNIDADGTILLPVVGKIPVAGLTLTQARDTLQNIVDDYLESPTVDIRLLSFQFTILGEVAQEGTYFNYSDKLSILDAVARAGGMEDFADPRKVKIVRSHGDSLEVVYINMLEEDLLASPYYYLMPNDVVSVAQLPAKNWQLYNLANLRLVLSSLTAVGIFFNIFDNLGITGDNNRGNTNDGP